MGRIKFITRIDRLFYKIEREKQWLVQDKKCYFCKTLLDKFELTFDHWIPLKDTDRYHSFRNCVVACERCNNKKSCKRKWSYEDTIPKYEKILREGLCRLEERIKRAEYYLSSDNKGGYSKWKKYWKKMNRWG